MEKINFDNFAQIYSFSFLIYRALGDFEYKNVEGKGPKEQLVSPEPEFYMKLREPEIDEFLVLACDGVWDVMTNEELVNFVSARMRVTDDLEAIANEVIDTCLHKVIIVKQLHFIDVYKPFCFGYWYNINFASIF